VAVESLIRALVRGQARGALSSTGRASIGQEAVVVEAVGAVENLKGFQNG
jgi:hypothetical protein